MGWVGWIVCFFTCILCGALSDPTPTEVAQDLFVQAMDKLQQGSLQQAFEYLHHALKADPEGPYAGLVAGNIGLILLQAKQTERAVDYFRRALTRIPEDADNSLRLALSLSDGNAAEQYDGETKRAYETVIAQNHPQRSLASAFLGDNELFRGEYEEARRLYVEAMVLTASSAVSDPADMDDQKDNFHRFASTHFWEGTLSQAIRTMEVALITGTHRSWGCLEDDVCGELASPLIEVMRDWEHAERLLRKTTLPKTEDESTSSEDAVVFVYSGSLPDCLRAVLLQIRCFSTAVPVYVIAERSALEEWGVLGGKARMTGNVAWNMDEDVGVRFVDVATLPMGLAREKFESMDSAGKVAWKDSQVLWKTAALRLFILEDFIRASHVRSVLHMEADIMTYRDLQWTLQQLQQIYGTGLAATPLGEFAWTAAVVYVGSAHVLSALTSFFADAMSLESGLAKRMLLSMHSSAGIHEMSLLQLYYQIHGDAALRALPTLPGTYRPKDGGRTVFDLPKGPRVPYADRDVYEALGNMVFDPASYGQYVAGDLRAQTPGFWTRKHFVGSAFADKSLDVTWRKDDGTGFWVPYGIVKEFSPGVSFGSAKPGDEFRIFDLHIHTKKPEPLLSCRLGRPILGQDVSFEETNQARKKDSNN